MTARRTKTRVCGPFVPDPDVPALTDNRGVVTQLGACARCHLIGQAGDSHHTLPVVPAQAVVAGRYEHEAGDER